MIKNRPSLAFCIAMDLLGYATYSLPFFGEFADVFWAPLSGLIFFIAFGGWKGAMGGVFGMVEELLPGTDFIPSFTIMWFIRNWQSRKSENSLPVSRKSGNIIRVS